MNRNLSSAVAFAVAFLLSISSLAQAQTVDEAIQDIREKYNQIENWPNVRVNEFEFRCPDDPFSGKIKRFLNHEKRPLKVEFDYIASDHGGSVVTYYFWQGQLFFVFKVDQYWRFDGQLPDGSSATRDTRRERRYYFRNGRCICLLEKEVSSRNADELIRLISKLENREIVTDAAEEISAEGTALYGIENRKQALRRFCE